jgi:Rrf2 family iron-sulfur cluster assembly transcriptional regulator
VTLLDVLERRLAPRIAEAPAAAAANNDSSMAAAS